MNLKDQVCSLDLAKKLKELRVKQESYFVWFTVKEGDYEIAESWQIVDEIDECEYYSAFTVTELGEMLPNELNKKYLTSHRCAKKGWWVFYSLKNDSDTDNDANWSMKEANARAKMLIYLIENNLISIEEEVKLYKEEGGRK